MNEIKCIKLLIQAIEQVTVNTYAEQRQVGADKVFEILEKVEREIKKTECARNQERPKLPKKTNFSKITESVESLAEFLAGITTTNFNCDTEKTVDGKYRDPFQDEKQGFIEWLQQEVENE